MEEGAHGLWSRLHHREVWSSLQLSPGPFHGWGADSAPGTSSELTQPALTETGLMGSFRRESRLDWGPTSWLMCCRSQGDLALLLAEGAPVAPVAMQHRSLCSQLAVPTLLLLLALVIRAGHCVHHELLSLCKGDPPDVRGESSRAREGRQGLGLFACTSPAASSASWSTPGVLPQAVLEHLLGSRTQEIGRSFFRAPLQPPAMSSGGGPWFPLTYVSSA